MKTNYWQNLEYGCHYHIYNRAVDGLVLFQSDTDYNLFLKKYTRYFQPYFTTFAYCLIPNHFHFIIRVKSKELIESAAAKETTLSANRLINGEGNVSDFLSDLFKRFFSSIAKSYNYKHNHRGPVFLERAKRVLIKNDDRLRYLIAYTHHNPIHHYLKQQYDTWVYSSYSSIYKDQYTLVDRDATLELFKGIDPFFDFHKAFQIIKLEETID